MDNINPFKDKRTRKRSPISMFNLIFSCILTPPLIKANRSEITPSLKVRYKSIKKAALKTASILTNAPAGL